jgi:DNA-binding response OmpR family regulator
MRPEAYHILLLEDEPQLAKIVRDTLQKQGYVVTHVNNGRSGLDCLAETRYDLFIVDIMLPLLDGLSFVRELRKKDAHTPALFLTAKSRTEDVIRGFEEGGNDYLKKPFSLEELLLRIKELLRRSTKEAPLDTVTPVGQYTFFPQKQELWLGGAMHCKLSHRENELLILLLLKKNQVLDRTEALTRVWGEDTFFNRRTMDVFMTKLRKHLHQDPAIEIINIRGVGYKLIA